MNDPKEVANATEASMRYHIRELRDGTSFRGYLLSYMGFLHRILPLRSSPPRRFLVYMTTGTQR